MVSGSSPHGQGADGLRWYTRARRIPTMVGRLPNSEHGLWGGPYTVTQVVGASAVLLVLFWTAPLWSSPLGLPATVLVYLLGGVGAVVGLRFVPAGGRNPVRSASGLLGAVLAPRWGFYRGQKIRACKRQQVHARALLCLTPLPAGPARPAAQTAPQPAPSVAAPRPVPEAAPDYPAVSTRAGLAQSRLAALLQQSSHLSESSL